MSLIKFHSKKLRILVFKHSLKQSVIRIKLILDLISIGECTKSNSLRVIATEKTQKFKYSTTQKAQRADG
jgi:hypothetical protein